METLVVHPKDENQLAAIKAFMKALDIDFEQQEHVLPDHVIDNISKSQSEAHRGMTKEFLGTKEMVR